MADDTPQSARENPGADEPLTINLKIVSPSAGVNALSFPQLPAETTVKGLKAKIRESVPGQPSDDRQRLIKNGRLLVRETETMLEIFGRDAVSRECCCLPT